MKIEEYPFVKSGPACTCGHARVRHVGRMKHMRRVRGFDLGCQACECEQYQPVGAALSDLHNAEFHRVAALRTIEATEAHRRTRVVQVVMLLAVMVAVANLLWFEGGERRFLGFVLGAVAFNTLNSAYSAGRNGDMAYAVVWLAGATVVVAPMLQLLVDFPWQLGVGYVGVVTVAAFGYLLWDGVQMQRDIRAWQAEMQESPEL